MMTCYHTVQIGKTILWVAADLIAFYVLATIKHLPAQDIVLVLMGGLAWHAISGLAVGQWLERRGGNGHGIAIVAGAAAPIACAAFVTSLLLADGHPWTALAAMMVSRSAYALFSTGPDPTHGAAGTANRAHRRNPHLWGQIVSLLLGLGLAPWLEPATTNGALAVLLLHFCATLMVATTNKVSLALIAPGAALATLSAGRILASIPMPARWREQHAGRKLVGSTLILLAAILLLPARPGPVTLFALGLASGWINIMTWVWLGHATDHPRPFGLAAMIDRRAWHDAPPR